MANFEATTASSGVKVMDVEAVKELIDLYDFPSELTVEVIEDGMLYIYGYEWFDASRWMRNCDGDEEEYEDMGDEFLENLRPLIAEEDGLIIDCIGGEKCRWPLSAMRIIVKRDGISYRGLEGGDQ